jgi:hypothetical protein
MKVKKSVLIGAVAILLAIGISAWAFVNSQAASKSEKIDSLAKCLTSNNAVMFGAYWCSHCQDQKKEFGASWKYVHYVECALPDNEGQTAACGTANITQYPTWDFNGSRQVGKLDFKTLGELSGCPFS